jgi:dGTPase
MTSLDKSLGERLIYLHPDEAITRGFDEFPRKVFQRDLDRVKYTRAFRRLKDVTQVARSGESYLYHDRLTHSLKVGQVGRRLAELALFRRDEGFVDDQERAETTPEYKLTDRLHPPAVEAACLAHDIGHPPFGHLAEHELDRLLDDETDGALGYEGNAQSFRVVTRLATGNDSISPEDGDPIHGTGIALTRATLNGMLKYPWGTDDSRADKKGKWGYYETERAAFEFAREHTASGRGQSLEAEIMDYADDLTYAIHDVTDFYKAGIIPLDRLLREADSDSDTRTPTLDEFREYIVKQDRELKHTSVDQLFKTLADQLGTKAANKDHLLTPFNGTLEERRTIDSFTSMLITRYISSATSRDPSDQLVRIEWGAGGYRLRIDDLADEQVWLLRKLTDYYVIEDASLMGQQRGQRELIENLFTQLLKEARTDDLNKSAISEPYRSWLDYENDLPGRFETPSHQEARVVADMITTMTEPQAVELHDRLTGYTPGTLHNRILR